MLKVAPRLKVYLHNTPYVNASLRLSSDSCSSCEVDTVEDNVRKRPFALRLWQSGLREPNYATEAKRLSNKFLTRPLAFRLAD